MSSKKYRCRACKRLVKTPWFVCPHCSAFKEIEETDKDVEALAEGKDDGGRDG